MSICSALLAALAVATVSAGSAAILPLGDSITLGCGSTGMPAGDNGCAAEAAGYRVPMMLALSQALTGTNSTVHTVGTLSNGPPSLAATGWLRHDGHPGFRIDQLDNTNGQSLYFDRWVAQRPDIITLHLGTNDCYQNYQPATLLTKMDTLLNHTFKALPRTFSWRPSWQRQTAGTGARRTGPQHHVCTGGGGFGAVCTGCVSGAWPLRVQERAPHRGRLPPSRLGVCLCSAAVL